MDQKFSRQVLARMHGMTRVRICKSKICQTCKELPDDNPPWPTEDTNILLRMRAERYREELVRQALPAAVPKPSPVVVPAPRTSVEQPRPVCKVPPVQGLQWAAVGNLISHAYLGGDSLCGKWPRNKANFDKTAYNYCRACQVEAFKILGFKAYINGERVCVKEEP